MSKISKFITVFFPRRGPTFSLVSLVVIIAYLDSCVSRD